MCTGLLHKLKEKLKNKKQTVLDIQVFLSIFNLANKQMCDINNDVYPTTILIPMNRFSGS